MGHTGWSPLVIYFKTLVDLEPDCILCKKNNLSVTKRFHVKIEIYTFTEKLNYVYTPKVSYKYKYYHIKRVTLFQHTTFNPLILLNQKDH